MKVTVETNLDFGWEVKAEDAGTHAAPVRTMLYQADVELAGRDLSVRALLEGLARSYPHADLSFIDPDTGEVDPEEYLVMVNGTAWEFLPRRLDTGLRDGDRVSLTRYLDLLGGG